MPPTRLLRAVEVLVLTCAIYIILIKKKNLANKSLKSKHELVNHTFVPLQATNNMQVPEMHVKVELFKFNSLFSISK